MKDSQYKYLHPLLLSAINVSFDDRVKEVQEWKKAGCPCIAEEIQGIIEEHEMRAERRGGQ